MKPDDRIHTLAWRHRGTRDPARVLEEAEQGTCCGCAYAITKTLLGQTAVACAKRIRAACADITESRRCGTYLEKSR